LMMLWIVAVHPAPLDLLVSTILQLFWMVSRESGVNE